jgi:hypothetical protein
MKVSGQLHDLAALTPVGKAPRTHCKDIIVVVVVIIIIIIIIII